MLKVETLLVCYKGSWFWCFENKVTEQKGLEQAFEESKRDEQELVRRLRNKRIAEGGSRIDCSDTKYSASSSP